MVKAALCWSRGPTGTQNRDLWGEGGPELSMGRLEGFAGRMAGMRDKYGTWGGPFQCNRGISPGGGPVAGGMAVSPDRQAVVSIHLSSCPTLSSPR